jgi:hypothetical protein
VRWRLAIAVALALAPAASAATPEARRLFPAGGSPGTAGLVVASGTFPVWPVSAWTDRGQVEWTCTPDRGVFRVAVPDDTAMGLHRVRFHDATGATAVRRFVVDPLPALAEAEPNDTPRSAQPMVTLPNVVDGVLAKAGEVDCFRVDIVRGQRLVASVDANERLASPFDPGLDLLDERGSLIARNLDAAGLDPRLVHVADRDGPVVVRVFGLPETPDSTIGLAGGEAFVYRLMLATGPVLARCVPEGAAAGALEPRGLDLPPGDIGLSAVGPGAAARPVRTAWLPGAAGVVELPVTDGPVTEAGPWPLDTPRVTPPVIVSGCLERPGEARGVRFAAVKGVALAIECAARSIGSAADSVLAIHDAAGRRLFVHDTPDERFTWKAPADGDYQLVVSDRRDEASPWHTFRVALTPPVPGVSITVAADAVSGTVGKPITIEVAIDRRHGFSTPLAIACDGLPAAGEHMPVASPAEGDAAKKVNIEVVCREPFSGPVRIVARPDGAPAATPLATAACGPEQVIDLWLTATAPAP